LKLLVDDNISWRLVKALDEFFPGSKHIRTIPELVPPAKDQEIWDYALRNHFIILTNDDDFYKLAITRKNAPKVIVLRKGNSSTANLLKLLIQKIPEVERFAENMEYYIFEIW
jgi:predicted nuclease of predicted toxin-antitoxin system